jgi:16S rRNA processing protein RimM
LKNYFKVGKLVSTYGLKGEIVLKHDLGKKTSLKNLEAFFIEEKTDAFLPYFIESTKIKNDREIYIKLDGISSKEAAHKLVQNEIWLLEDDFKKFAAGSAPISLLGFIMVNDNQDLGEILEVIEQPHQVLCKILIDGKEALIPVHQDSLEKIDKKNRKVFVDLPEGLLDIYRASSSSSKSD